jgi:hypothetical protein
MMFYREHLLSNIIIVKTMDTGASAVPQPAKDLFLSFPIGINVTEISLDCNTTVTERW